MDVREFFETKRTYRKFQQQSISDEIINEILEAARLSSSGGNKQSLKYIVVRSSAGVKKVNNLVKYAAYLPSEVGSPKANEIPVLFIAVLQDTNVSPVNDTDAGIAISNMATAAWMEGVGSVIMGAIDRPAIKNLLQVPESCVLHTVIGFGYPATKSKVVDMTDSDVKYYLDEEGNTRVPKRSLEEIASFYD